MIGTGGTNESLNDCLLTVNLGCFADTLKLPMTSGCGLVCALCVCLAALLVLPVAAFNQHVTRMLLPTSINVMRHHTELCMNRNVVAVKGNGSDSIRSKLKVIYKFCRPHTIKGTILASSMGVTRSLIENPSAIKLSLVPRALIGLVALLCGNAYIVGINQIYDVKIDEINKPFLPIAAKELSTANAWKLVISSILVGFYIVCTQFSKEICTLYSLGAILGTIYSVPPLQLKRFPLFAGTIIAFVRGFLLNFGVYYAVREALYIPFKWNPVVTFISSFMTVFAGVIAVTKDLPDIEGDKKYNISTLASKYGVAKIASISSAVLALTYTVSIMLPFITPAGSFNKLPMSAGHGLLLLYLINIHKKLNPTNISSIKQFYKSIWNLFYFEYLLYIFI